MNNPPAFPQPRDYDDAYPYMKGMTLRDYFAAKAMQLFVRTSEKETIERFATDASKGSYIIADAMLKAREQ